MFLPRRPKAQECATPRSPASNRSRFTYTRNLFCRTASVLGRPLDQYPPPLTHETSSDGPRPPSAAPVEQKFASSNTRKLFSRTASVLGRPRRIEPCQINGVT